MRYFSASLLLVLSGYGNFALAQQAVAPAPVAVAAPVPVAAAPAPNAPDASGRYMLRDGTDVNLIFAQDLTRSPKL
jgi:hypothetical protein